VGVKRRSWMGKVRVEGPEEAKCLHGSVGVSPAYLVQVAWQGNPIWHGLCSSCGVLAPIDAELRLKSKRTDRAKAKRRKER